MAIKQQPILVRITAGRMLRALREQKGMKYADCTVAKLGSKAKLERIEAGSQALMHSQIALMCQVYSAGEDVTQKLLEYCDAGYADAWWEKGGLPEWFSTYIELETMAHRVRTYEGEVIPGLLQSPQYQQAMFAQDGTRQPDKQLAMRTKRQTAAFNRQLKIAAIIGEGAFNRTIGGPAAMVEQRDYLLKLDTEQRIDIRVLPYSSGAHPALKGPFSLLDFDNRDLPGVVYYETYSNGRYESGDTVLGDFHHRWDVIQDLSVPIKEHLK